MTRTVVTARASSDFGAVLTKAFTHSVEAVPLAPTAPRPITTACPGRRNPSGRCHLGCG